jgi:hypothetical protein
MDSTAEFAQLQLRVVDQTQGRYEVIRPLVLFAHRTATQRAHETAPQPDTVRALHRRCRQQAMVGLLPANIEVRQRVRAGPIPDDVREESDRLQALYGGFPSRELARISFCQCADPLDDKTANSLWPQSPVPTQHPLEWWPSHPQPDRYQARLHVVKLYDQGWDQLSSSRFLPVSRPTVDTWIARFDAEHCAGLMDQKRGPKEPPRTVWLPRLGQVYHRQKAHPDAGAWRRWSLLAPPDIAVRTVGRILALHKLVYAASPPVSKPGPPSPSQPHPYKAQHRHADWCIDGRQMAFARAGVPWWSRLILEGDSRPRLAGAMAPTAATWAALMVLDTACLRYGAPPSGRRVAEPIRRLPLKPSADGWRAPLRAS